MGADLKIPENVIAEGGPIHSVMWYSETLESTFCMNLRITFAEVVRKNVRGSAGGCCWKGQSCSFSYTIGRRQDRSKNVEMVLYLAVSRTRT